MPMLGIDRNEPVEALPLLKPVVPECYIDGLNDRTFADYMWRDCGNRVHHWERKTWSEILTDNLAVEDQLRREMAAHPDATLGLLVEGVATPDGTGMQIWSRGKQRREVFYKARRSYSSARMIYSWLHQIGRFMEVAYSADFHDSMAVMAAFYHSDQKPEQEHTTFQRHFKKVAFHPNPQVQRLMNTISGLGEKYAEALIAEFGTAWNVYRAGPQDLAVVQTGKGSSIGLGLAQRILREIGRPDV